MLKQVAEIM